MLTTVTLVVALVLTAAQAQPPQQQQPPPAGQDPQQQRPPVFRTGTTLVQVDAYPQRDGRIVEGLAAADFEVFEDGKPQAIEDLQFIRIEPNTPIAERLDPNTQEEGYRLAADPRNRVFVLYLDHYHVDLTGSHRMRRPVIDMLHRLLTPTDLFGVMTPILRPRDLILGRRTETLEEQLADHWTWGGSGQERYEPDEEALIACSMSGYPIDLGRRRQEKLLDSLDGLVEHLGRMREARKVLLLFTRGWPMYSPRQRATVRPTLPQVGVTPFGRLSSSPGDGRVDGARCSSEMLRLDAFDSHQRLRDLLTAANRNNVSFYPVNPGGLETPEGVKGNMQGQFDAIRDRWQLLLTLAENTDGIAARSNDMAADLRRITDDVSAYYVLSYYSTNPAQDGKYRRIQVKVKPDGIAVKARRGYMAPDAAAVEAARAAAAAGPKTPPAVDEALAALARLRPAAELFSHVSATARELAVVVELPADRAFTGRWATGADVVVTATDAGGAEVGRASGRIEPPARGQVLRLALPEGSGGPWAVATRVGDGGAAVSDRVDVAAPGGALAGDAIFYRARPPASAPLHPVADYMFRRTERLHVDWPLFGAIDRREARVLGRNGAPLALPVTVTERDLSGQPTLSMDLALAPLTEADYLIELTVGQGDRAERTLIAFRVIR
jgi:VWFA-related protein